MKPSFRPRLPGRQAFTLIEVVITLGISTMFVLWVLTFTTITFQQGVFSIGNYTDLNGKSRGMLDNLSRDIRNSASLISYATNALTFSNLNGTVFSYRWDGSNCVTRAYNGVTTTLLTNCDYLSFGIYLRVPTNNFSFYSATGAVGLTKLVDVSWRCSRSYLGSKLNTESVQTARVVIRN
ncbi:MAG TPA: prepilin-type N-terminal cleavage/methylation domain-containing protein [Verrucomicrobiae bacterium]